MKCLLISTLTIGFPDLQACLSGNRERNNILTSIVLALIILRTGAGIRVVGRYPVHASRTAPTAYNRRLRTKKLILLAEIESRLEIAWYHTLSPRLS